MRPTKSFVVEYKRNSRRIARPSTIQIPDRAVENLKPAVRKFVTASHAAAFAIFQKVDEACPSIEAPPVARRILPVIVEEQIAPPAPKTRPARSTARDPAPKGPRKVSRPKAKVIIQPGPSKDMSVEAEKAAVPVVSEALTLPARKLPSRRISRLKEAEDNLPRGQRWKRRLPKFMR